MEKEIIITLGLVIGYLLYRAVSRKQKRPTDVYSNMSELQSNSEHAQKSDGNLRFPVDTKNAKHFSVSTISGILTNDKYKVKGQWDK